MALTDNIFLATELGVLYNDDCLNILPLLPSESVDVLITDPLYNVGIKEKNGINYIDKGISPDIPVQIFRVLKEDSRAFVFSAQKTLVETIKLWEKAGFKLHQILVWGRYNVPLSWKIVRYDFVNSHEFILLFWKGNPRKRKKIVASKEFHRFDLLIYSQPQSNFENDKKFHVNQKPIKLIRHLIKISTEKDWIVLDPFIGSGTTAIACENLGRKWENYMMQF